jgi:hypothetical protein
MLPPLPKTPPAPQARNAIGGLYYKPITIVNDDSSVVNNFEISLTDDTRVDIYNWHMFIVQATADFYSKTIHRYI